MAVIFYPPRNTGGGGGAATWGSITGTLSSQTDLQTALNAKLNVASPSSTGSYTHTGTAAASEDVNFNMDLNGRFRITNNSTGRTVGWQTAIFRQRFDAANTNQVGLAVDFDHTSGTASASNLFTILSSNIGGLHKGTVSLGYKPNATFTSSADVRGKLSIANGGAAPVFFGSESIGTDRRFFIGSSSSAELGIVVPNGTDYDLTMPSTQGGAGTVLQNNGSGVLSWATPSGGGGSNVTLSYVRNIVNNLNTGFNISFVPNATQEVFGIASTGRVFWGVTDANSAVAYTAATVNGTYSQIALTNNGSGSGGFIFDIGPSAEGFVYYRSAAISNWTRWNGTSMVPVTTYPSSPGIVNPGTGLGYNGNFAFVAFATPEVMRYSTDNADTWANGSSSWLHTSGTQHSQSHIAIGVVGSGSTWVIITQLNSNPVSANCSYGAISGTPTKQLFPNGHINPQAFTSNGTVMYVYFENGMLGRTTDGANWTYLAVGNGEALTTYASWSLVIRSSDVLLISNAKVYSIAQDLSAVNWIRLVDNIGGTAGSTRKNHQKIGVISNELYIPFTSGIMTNSVGYISSSIEKYTFS